MAKRELRIQAVDLRKRGFCYSEIKKCLGIPKSTLSNWLTKYPLTDIQMLRIKNKRSLAIERYRETMRIKRIQRYKTAVSLERSNLIPLNQRDLMIGGLFLYWGEGGKTNKGQINLSNSDPKILKLMKLWLMEIFNIPVAKMRLRLTLYTNMDIDKEKSFWSNTLDIPLKQFRKIQIKEGKGRGLFGFKHGTCELVVTDTEVKMRIMAGLELLGDWSEV